MKQKLKQKQSQKLSLTPQLKKQIELLSNSNEESRKELLTLVEKYLDLEKKPIRYFRDLMLISKYSSFLYSEEFIEKKLFEANNKKTLNEELLEQLNLSDLKEHQILIGQYLIDYIDSEGRLSLEVDYEDIKKLIYEVYSKTISEKEIKYVLGKIQRLEPIGCGYRSIKESLLIQIEEISLDLKAKNRLEELVEGISNSSLEYENLLDTDRKLLKKLNFLPSINFSTDRENYIRPDLIVRKNKGKFSVILNDRFLNESLYQMIAEQIQAEKDENKDLIEEKNIISGLKKREESLVEIGKIILRSQTSYLEGKGPLLPLGISDLATKSNLSKSTISRLMSSKYIEVNNKNLPLNHFLQRKVNKTKSGKDITSHQLQTKIAFLIDNEDIDSPLSDQQIKKELFERFKIALARRTVTKYRISLNLKSSRNRKG
tara:strand:+ start:1968 stop:3257 length:1290 start_codon:yes stop_codon:yes gene_type:complete